MIFTLSMAQWNDLYPIGTPVRYWPVQGREDYVDTRTRSLAWTLGDGTSIVKIDGRTGGVSIDHCRVLVTGEVLTWDWD